MLSAFLAAALGPLILSPEAAVAAAYHDATKVPPYDRRFMRYLYWDRTWARYGLMTKSQQALISLERDFPTPVVVVPGLVRVDLRDSGHQHFLAVWENFREIDFVFHVRKKYFKPDVYRTYHPQGYYPREPKLRAAKKTWYDWSVEDVPLKPGDVNFEVAPWFDPLVEAKPDFSIRAQTELRKLLHTEVPILWGPFWMVRVARQRDINNTVNGVGYFDWFGIRNRDDYFNILVVNEDALVKRYRELRSFVQFSDVSEQSRIITLLDERTWGTLDVFTQKDLDEVQRGQVRRNLRRGELKHDAERWIGRKADGLWLNGLFAANGLVQEAAPTKIGTDTSTVNTTRDKEIHPNSCVNCHAALPSRNFIIEYEDWLRENVVEPYAVLRDGKRSVEIELSEYFRSMRLPIKQAKEGFADSVARLTSSGEKDPGMTVNEFMLFMQRDGFYRYVDPRHGAQRGVTAELAADWLGVRKEDLIAGLRRFNASRGASDMICGQFINAKSKNKGITLMEFEDSYTLLQVLARGVIAPELVIYVKNFDGNLNPAPAGGKSR